MAETEERGVNVTPEMLAAGLAVLDPFTSSGAWMNGGYNDWLNDSLVYVDPDRRVYSEAIHQFLVAVFRAMDAARSDLPRSR